MMYPIVPVQEWLDRYGLMVLYEKCEKCAETMQARPCYMKNYAGIEMFCSCGHTGPATFTPTSIELKEFWKGVMS